MSKIGTYHKSPSEEALNRFVWHIGEINKRLEELQQYTENHMGYAPEEINWSHVGTAAHVLKELTELTDMAYGRGEYSKSEDNH